MNKHLPYREWIFEEDALPADSGRGLRLHLQQCAECRSVAEGWENAKRCLESAPVRSPRDGFAARWKALARDRLDLPDRRPAWALLAVSSAGSLATAALLAVQTSGRGLSLAGVFARDMSAAAGMLEEWSDASQALGGFINTASKSIPPACYLFAVFFLSLTGLLCLLMVIRANSRRAKR
jgi:hypothetical protein